MLLNRKVVPQLTWNVWVPSWFHCCVHLLPCQPLTWFQLRDHVCVITKTLRIPSLATCCNTGLPCWLSSHNCVFDRSCLLCWQSMRMVMRPFMWTICNETAKWKWTNCLYVHCMDCTNKTKTIKIQNCRQDNGKMTHQNMKNQKKIPKVDSSPKHIIQSVFCKVISYSRTIINN